MDFGNTENIQNRNRIYDEGFIGLIEGILKSETSLISELHLQSACVTGEGLFALSMLQNTDLQVLDLANNDLGNEAA